MALTTSSPGFSDDFGEDFDDDMDPHPADCHPVHALTHARHDRATCLAPGLFRSLGKGERKTAKLDVKYQHGNESVRFWGPEPLGVDDLRAVQVLVAAAGAGKQGLGPEPETEVGRKLRNQLDLGGVYGSKESTVVAQSFSRLLRELGMTDSGTAIRGFKESLRRLAAVTIIVTQAAGEGSREASSRLLSYAFDDVTGSLLVALNPRVTRAIVVGTAAHARIPMDEVRSLNNKSDAAKLIHQRLCAWVNPGESRLVGLNKLCECAWPNSASPAAARKRRQRTRQAVDDLRGIGWGIQEYATGKFKVSRPAIRKEDNGDGMTQDQAPAPSPVPGPTAAPVPVAPIALPPRRVVIPLPVRSVTLS